eukprot:c15077_g1_i1.p1 GENE.c15077_g1_i1~~c15077_g1_i1.p1  ORF type:complete len:845 (-),score=153.29 c15077_g1_i1:28-2562(-)
MLLGLLLLCTGASAANPPGQLMFKRDDAWLSGFAEDSGLRSGSILVASQDTPLSHDMSIALSAVDRPKHYHMRTAKDRHHYWGFHGKRHTTQSSSLVEAAPIVSDLSDSNHCHVSPAAGFAPDMRVRVCYYSADATDLADISTYVHVLPQVFQNFSAGSALAALPETPHTKQSAAQITPAQSVEHSNPAVPKAAEKPAEAPALTPSLDQRGFSEALRSYKKAPSPQALKALGLEGAYRRAVESGNGAATEPLQPAAIPEAQENDKPLHLVIDEPVPEPVKEDKTRVLEDKIAVLELKLKALEHTVKAHDPNNDLSISSQPTSTPEAPQTTVPTTQTAASAPAVSETRTTDEVAPLNNAPSEPVESQPTPPQTLEEVTRVDASPATASSQVTSPEASQPSSGSVERAPSENTDASTPKSAMAVDPSKLGLMDAMVSDAIGPTVTGANQHVTAVRQTDRTKAPIPGADVASPTTVTVSGQVTNNANKAEGHQLPLSAEAFDRKGFMDPLTQVTAGAVKRDPPRRPTQPLQQQQQQQQEERTPTNADASEAPQSAKIPGSDDEEDPMPLVSDFDFFPEPRRKHRASPIPAGDNPDAKHPNAFDLKDLVWHFGPEQQGDGVGLMEKLGASELIQRTKSTWSRFRWPTHTSQDASRMISAFGDATVFLEEGVIEPSQVTQTAPPSLVPELCEAASAGQTEAVVQRAYHTANGAAWINSDAAQGYVLDVPAGFGSASISGAFRVAPGESQDGDLSMHWAILAFGEDTPLKRIANGSFDVKRGVVTVTREGQYYRKTEANSAKIGVPAGLVAIDQCTGGQVMVWLKPSQPATLKLIDELTISFAEKPLEVD